MMRSDAAADAATAAAPGDGNPAAAEVAGVTEILADMKTLLFLASLPGVGPGWLLWLRGAPAWSVFESAV